MKVALEVINKMQADGVIGQYAIGGATGALFYIEAINTVDVDIFTFFKSTSMLDPLREIFDYLTPLGYGPKGEFLMIAGTQLQFLPVADELYREAVNQAVERQYEGVTTWVMTPEHLMAIALRLGRSKDFDRIDRFLDVDACDKDDLMDILKRYQLTAKWESFMLRRIQ